MKTLLLWRHSWINDCSLLASNSCSNGHEGAKGAASLHHHLTHTLDQLTSSHSHSKRSKATKDAARGHANTHAHHEAHLHPVKAGWLPSSMHGSLWHGHAGPL